MNILIGDSRSRNLDKQDHLKGIVEVWAKPGAGLDRVSAMIEDHYFFHHGGQPIHNGINHYYIMAGICQVTNKIRNPKERYEEVVYKETPNETLQKIIPQVANIRCQIKELEAIPVFCPLYPIDLFTWNDCRLNQSKTIQLKYQDEYETMQVALNQAIVQINEHLTQINRLENVATPMIHRCLQHNRKNRKPENFTWQLHKMSDGCHPDDLLANEIAKSISRAIRINRQ